MPVRWGRWFGEAAANDSSGVLGEFVEPESCRERHREQTQQHNHKNQNLPFSVQAAHCSVDEYKTVGVIARAFDQCEYHLSYTAEANQNGWVCAVEGLGFLGKATGCPALE